jgi:hypothetical protein
VMARAGLQTRLICPCHSLSEGNKPAEEAGDSLLYKK